MIVRNASTALFFAPRWVSLAEAERRDPRTNGKGDAFGRLHREFPGELRASAKTLAYN